jgi:uncharacterized protein
MEVEFRAGNVQGMLHEPDSPRGDAIALTHGAGSNANAPLLIGLARAFCDAGYLVLRYDLAFRRSGRKGPPLPAYSARDRESIVETVQALRTIAPGRIFAGGHSYGGRQTAMAASEDLRLADALLLLSYPLHPPAKPAQLRTAFFPALETPALFVHGTADPFATSEELRHAVALIPARTDLLPVEGAAHDLKRAAGLSSEILTRLNALLF